MTGIGNTLNFFCFFVKLFCYWVQRRIGFLRAVIKIDEEQVQLMKRRGGVGHDLSHIRPSGSPKNSALTLQALFLSWNVTKFHP